MKAILLVFAAAVVSSIPLLVASRSQRRLTWTWAIVLGFFAATVMLLLIADIPSRILYLFDAQHSKWAARYSWLRFMQGDAYLYPRDVVANTVQGIFFVILCVAAYRWGERHRKSGRFKS